MPEALDVTCPCCEALLKVDPETRSVVWVDKKKAPAKDFDDLVNRVRSQKSVLDEKFAALGAADEAARARSSTRSSRRRARRAAVDPHARPPHPFDNE